MRCLAEKLWLLLWLLLLLLLLSYKCWCGYDLSAGEHWTTFRTSVAPFEMWVKTYRLTESEDMHKTYPSANTGNALHEDEFQIFGQNV